MRSTSKPRRRSLRWWLAGGAAAVTVFALGVAVGQALDDSPDPRRAPSQTFVRTFTVPLPSPSRTVTVTTTEGE